MGAPMPRYASPSSPAGHGSARRAKQAPPMPCRSASPFLVPARHSFALRVPARLSLRLCQAFPIAAQSTATDVPRLLLHSKRNRKIPPPPENFGVWGAVRIRAIPPSAALFRRRCRFHSGCKKLIIQIQMPPWSQNCPFATERFKPSIRLRTMAFLWLYYTCSGIKCQYAPCFLTIGFHGSNQ